MPPRTVGAGAQPSASKVSKKERIIQALTRMNDRDTQKAAAEELFSILLNMDQEGLPIILNGLCTTGSEHKVYARKECARAIGIIASDACPLREQALQQPHLGKMLGQLRKSLQDVDSGVREASSEALALVAQGLAVLTPGAVQGTLANPVLKLIFDSLVEQKKDLNAAACAALGMAAPYVGTLEASLARELVRKLNSPTFQAPAQLMAALARTDLHTGEPVGLLKSGPAAFVPLMSSLVGQPASGGVGSSGGSAGSGITGALGRPDWPVRLAAADAMRAAALFLGPLMELEGCWTAGDARSITGRAIRGLESCRFDKVRDVRDVARAALAVMEELQAYGSQGGNAAGWPAHIAAKLYGRDVAAPAALPNQLAGNGYMQGLEPSLVPSRKSPLRRSATSPSRRPRSSQPSQPVSRSPPRRSPTPPERRSSPLFARAGSLSERFRAAHRDGDVVEVLYPGPLTSASETQQEGAGDESGAQREDRVAAPRPAVTAWPQDDTLPDVALSNRAVSRQQSRAVKEENRLAEGPLAVEPLFSVRSVAGQEGQSAVLPQPPSSSGGGAADAAAMMSTLGLYGPADPLLDSGGPPTFSRYTAEPPRPVARPFVPPAPSSSGGGAPPAPSIVGSAMPSAPLGPSLQGPTVTIPTEEWLASQQRLRTLEAQHQQLLTSFDVLSNESRQTITSLQAKVLSLEAALEAAKLQLAMAAPPPPLGEDPEKSWLSRTIKPGSPMLPPNRTSANTPAMGRPTPPAPPNVTVSSPRARTASPSLPQRGVQDPAVGASAAGGDPAAALAAAASDVRQAYREALSTGRPSEMQLLRLMQRTGPVWNELGYELACQLLASFTASLQQARADGPMISRMLPWLWRLADDQRNTFTAPQELRGPLLTALCSAQPSVTDAALYEKLGLLVSTLRAHWSLPEPAPPLQRAPSGSLPITTPPAVYPAAAHAAPLLGNHYVAAAPSASGLTPPANRNPVGSGWSAPGPSGDSELAQTPSSSPSPAQEGLAPSSARLAAVRSSQGARTPSISTLMGQWSDLQRDFAAMSSPAGKPPARTTGQ